MYQKIMVPLDGSELAECVLPHVEAIAGGCQVKDIIFVRVVEPLHLRGGVETGFSPEERQRLEAESMDVARNYLNQVISRSKYDEIGARSEVLFGTVTDTLADYAENNDIDLIIIATHGRSGISRWVWGGVADRLLRSACVPVLIVRAPGCIPGI